MKRRSLPVLVSLTFAWLVGGHLADPALAHAEDAPVKKRPAWLAEKHMLEVGLYMGALFPAKDHGLYGEGITSAQRPLKNGFDVGLRIAYLPLRFVGIEAEGGITPSKVVYTDGDGEEARRKVTLYALRAHVILQLPTQLSLFVLAGGGVQGVSSKNDALGKNADGTFHVGGGLKYYLHKKVVLRIDGRDIIGPAWTKGMASGPTWTHHAEFTFGASFVLGRQSTKMLKKG
jgi:opacity protein-like surface antigen